jgi:hypothetical protein
VSTVKYKLGFYIPEDGILHSHCRGNLKSYSLLTCSMSCVAYISVRTVERTIHSINLQCCYCGFVAFMFCLSPSLSENRTALDCV